MPLSAIHTSGHSVLFSARPSQAPPNMRVAWDVLRDTSKDRKEEAFTSVIAEYLRRREVNQKEVERYDIGAAHDEMLVALFRQFELQNLPAENTPAHKHIDEHIYRYRQRVIEDIYLKICAFLKGGVLAPSLLGAKKSQPLTEQSLNRLRALTTKLIGQAQRGNGESDIPNAPYLVELAIGPSARLQTFCDIRKLGGQRFVLNGPPLYIVRALSENTDLPEEGMHALKYQIRGGSETLEMTNAKGKTFRLQTEHHYKSRGRKPVFTELNQLLLQEIEQREPLLKKS